MDQKYDILANFFVTKNYIFQVSVEANLFKIKSTVKT
jgi:hypothetical protein